MFFTTDNGGLQPTTRFGRHFANSIYIVGAVTLLYAAWMLFRPVIFRRTAKDYARAETLESDRSGSSGLPESPERIALLESLLMDCRPSPGRATTTADMSTCNTLLYQLGVAYLSRREAPKSQNYLEEALTLAQQRDDSPLTAEVTQVLGRTLAEQRQFEAAQEAYQNALAQFRQLGNRRTEANTPG